MHFTAGGHQIFAAEEQGQAPARPAAPGERSHPPPFRLPVGEPAPWRTQAPAEVALVCRGQDRMGRPRGPNLSENSELPAGCRKCQGPRPRCCLGPFMVGPHPQNSLRPQPPEGQGGMLGRGTFCKCISCPTRSHSNQESHFQFIQTHRNTHGNRLSGGAIIFGLVPVMQAPSSLI